MSKILIVDDDPAVQASLALLLKHAGHKPVTVSEPEQADKVIAEIPPDLVLLDMNFSRETSGQEGLDFLKRINSDQPNIPVILITAWGSIDLAVEGMKSGAVDFINKPWQNDHMLESVETALKIYDSQTIAGSISGTRSELDTKYDLSKIIGEDRRLLDILATIGRVSKTSASILILGESGTGKELVAEAIHLNSERADQPFVKVNLGGISSTLFESEMFGHKKGAFTDARSDRSGRFQKADHGSIFLDEIGDLHRASQVKLLRVLQDRTFEILGSSQTKQVDVRLICATNRNLNQMVTNGDFREDLYYRINLITVKLPALWERVGDIPILARHFVDNLKIIYGRADLQVDNQALEWLKTLSWPGNIRELKNLVERTVLVSDSNLIRQPDFARQLERAPKPNTKTSLPQVGEMTLEEIEISMIQKALEFHTGNIKQVAQSLGLSRAALYRRLEKYGINA